ncbi:hypothetical protein [Dactylosporangium sp. NPDC051484]|uniref:hypothetical protein n=1 Tax=Dactylosporangium sp. NPDC051484 TaxID=3154942 RepID=UPI003450874C
MSDFDEVLERLLSDQAFKARLAADPAGALAEYRLTPDELDVLRSQVGDAGGQTHVEQRTSKASMFGVFSSIGSGLGDVLHGHGVSAHGLAGHAPGGGGAAVGHHMHDLVEQQHAAVEPADHGSGSIGGQLQDIAHGGRHASAGFEEVHTESRVESHTEYHSEVRSSGTVYQSSTYAAGTGGTPHEPSGGKGVAAGLAGLGAEGGPAGPGGGVAGGLAGLGAEGGQAGPGGGVAGGLAGGLAGLGEHAAPGGHGGIGAGLGAIGQHDGGQAGLGQAGLGQAGAAGHDAGIGAGLAGFAQHAGHAQVPGAAPTDGYHTRVDWDGDGRWDQHTYVNRADGGVDIVVDTDGDGRPEFVGHDTDRDGLINSSEIDTNHDGVMDARYEDVNGDGWLDRRTR